MKKCFVGNTSLLALTLLVLPLFALPMQSGNAPRTFTGEVMDSICAPSGSHAATITKMPSMGSNSETCTKKCMALGAKYMLYDQESHTAYSVENQDELARFAGHKVRITGTVAGSKISVEKINSLG